MFWYLNRKIRTKIIVGFVIVACLAAAIGTIGIIDIRTVDDNDTILYEEMTVPISILAQFSESFQRTRVDIREMLLFDNIPRIEKEYNKIVEKRDSNEGFLKDYEARIINNEEMKTVFEQFKGVYSQYNQVLDQVANDIILGNVDQAWKSIDTGKLHDLEYQLIDMLDTMCNKNTSAGAEQARYNTEITDNAIRKMTIIICIAFVLAILLGWLISRVICKPINQLVKASNMIAIGDTDIKIQQNRKDEIGYLMDSFQKMIEGIKEQAAVSEQIAAGNFNIEIPIRSEKDVLNKSIQHMSNTINHTSNEINKVIENIENGKFKQNNNYDQLEGGWGDIAKGINHIVDSFVSYFDALPIVVMAIDNEYNINYLNKTGADMFGDQQDAACGKKCYDYWGTQDCGTEACVCDSTMKNKEVATSDNLFNLGEKQMHIYCSAVPITDGQGNVTGALEIVLDQTQIKQAQIVSEKQAEYQKCEVEKLVKNLEKFAQGNLDIKTFIEQSDEDTEEIANNFRKINGSLEESTSQIRSYIEELSKVLSDMAAKDFAIEIQREYLGDFVKIKDSINYIINQFNTILTEINESAQQVESGAKQVATSSQSLSQGASEQAGSIEEISASIVQIADQTRENAENANKANDLSIQIKTDAHTGNSQMDEMLTAMNDIKDSSKNISNIIKVI
ncbi:MAG: MCP four helix bundle domain-containing protein, partial [Clostridia bacterium]|nr:MCP four helix bundle domain-containing protein [Clostridia bacterium]